MRRGRIEIMASILEATIQDGTPAHVVERCRLSQGQFKKYTQLLVDNRLLETISLTNLRHKSGPKNIERIKFQVTESGKKFLKLYGQIRSMVDRRATTRVFHFSFPSVEKQGIDGRPTHMEMVK